MTPSIPDLSKLLPSERTALASRVQALNDFQLPSLKYFNSSPCADHDEVQTWCRVCGIKPRAHQRVGSVWLYAKQKALLCDETGLGKTASIALVIAMLKETGNLDTHRAVVVCRAAAVKQWERELHRMLPLINTKASIGPAKKRLDTMRSDWDVLVTGKELFSRDWEAYNQLDLALLAIDDCDELRHRKTNFATVAKKVARHARWVIVANATPLAKALSDLHSTTEMVGGREVFGSETRFLNTYTVQKKIHVPMGNGRIRIEKKIQAYTNLDQFKALLQPMALRRTAADLDDVDMPAVVPQTVYLTLHPAQRQKYKELQDGILKIIKEGRLAEIKHLEALQIWAKGMAVCAGLPAIGEDDGPGASAKLDWVMDKIKGDLSSEKVLVFIHNLAMIKAAQSRLEAEGIDYVTISGLDSNYSRRNDAVQKFWDDDSCRVLLGTKAMTSSLNLQTARHLVFLDSIPNPASMLQVLGRIKRQGSKYQTVYAHTLVAVDTQDEALATKLEMEAALMDTIWDDANDLFQQLDSETLLQMIAG